MRKIRLSAVTASAALMVGATGWSPRPTAIARDAVEAETMRLEFHASAPLTTGSAEDQARTGLARIVRETGRGRLVAIRVFAASADDLVAARRAIESVMSVEKRALPVLSLVRVVAFPGAGQRVQLEWAAEGQGAVNPHGLVFLAGLAAPTGERTFAGLARVAAEAGLRSEDVTRVSCFYEAADQLAGAKEAAARTFPRADAAFVQSTVADSGALVECEGVGRSSTTSERIRYVNLPGTTPSPYFSRATVTSARTLIFTGVEMVLGAADPDIRDALDRLKKSVETRGGTLPDVVMSDNYWVTPAARDRVRAMRPSYFGTSVPASTGVVFAGLPSTGATAGIEIIVAGRP
jgi:enamine deaminase RidA (YjgF/YER057c/UK114 family)